jgi:hypothetical protein
VEGPGIEGLPVPAGRCCKSVTVIALALAWPGLGWAGSGWVWVCSSGDQVLEEKLRLGQDQKLRRRRQ